LTPQKTKTLTFRDQLRELPLLLLGRVGDHRFKLKVRGRGGGGDLRAGAEETEELVGPGSDTKEETFRIVIVVK
jgi:hypothetical protein